MKKRISLLLGLGLSTIAFGKASQVDVNEQYAKTLYQRLAGAPILREDPRLEEMTTLIADGDYLSAAAIATTDMSFYDVTLRSWAAKFSNVDQTPLQGLNDTQATLIGTVRDEIDARLLLTGDFRYEAYDDLSLPPVSPNNNDHYQQFDQSRYYIGRHLRRVAPQWRHIPEAAGVLTSRGWGEAHMVAGTNRRALEYTFKVFLCTPIQTWRDPGLPDFYVRRDVNRSPGGNPETYQQDCRTCHAGMDAMAGAYARFNYDNGSIQYAGRHRIFPKFNNNGHIYPDGFVTFDDSWLNISTRNHNTAFGWRGELRGKGINSFGKMIANSKMFGQCMVKRAFVEVCNRELQSSEIAVTTALGNTFESNGYNLKDLFQRVATHEACIDRETL